MLDGSPFDVDGGNLLMATPGVHAALVMAVAAASAK